jgi:hypothetical protein
MLSLLKFFWFVTLANCLENFMIRMGLIKAITVTDIIAEYGAYYRNSGQNTNRILKMLTQETVTTGIMTPAKTDETIYEYAQGTITSLLQPFQKAYTAKGALAFTPNKIALKHFKVDFNLDPDDIEATWLGFLAAESLTRKEWPIVRFALEQYLLPKMREEYELEVVYNGVEKAVTPDVAGDAKDIINGLGKLLADGVAAGTINLVAGLGPLHADTIFDQVEQFTKGISNVYKSVPMEVCMSPSWVRAYLTDKRAQGFYQISGPGQIDRSVDFTPLTVKGLPSMEGKNDIFATPKANMIHLSKKSINQNRFNIEESKRQLAVMTDWWEGFGFGINEIVWTNYGTGSASN